MIEIVPASENNIPDIQQISNIAWPDAFQGILSPEQIKYMMNWMYSDASLREQISEMNHHYVLAKEDEDFLGYMSYETNCNNKGKTKIHKIYLLPDQKKKGIGRLLFDFAVGKAKSNKDTSVFLNVNKHNLNAIDFYRKMGFKIVWEEVNDIGNGFVMDDYVFEIAI